MVPLKERDDPEQLYPQKLMSTCLDFVTELQADCCKADLHDPSSQGSCSGQQAMELYDRIQGCAGVW